MTLFGWFISHFARVHNSGRSRFTANKKPWAIAYTEEYSTKELAQNREREIKKKKSKEYIEYLLRWSSERKNL
ncbi:MAG: GIY-YIG nuclease family protein [Planctomycetes bacterium]|nr:GIY-YIG nuclease family protein [Planctomycetota bacterium]